MRIGELAQTSATPVETIRFYEREGLLAKPARTEGNYRIYGGEHARRLGFIRQCRALDMTLDEVRALLSFRDSPTTDCSGVNGLLDEHIRHVVARIRELKTLERELRQLRAQCVAPEDAARCGILLGLDEAVVRPVASRAARHVKGPH